jgi:hypothetical protein
VLTSEFKQYTRTWPAISRPYWRVSSSTTPGHDRPTFNINRLHFIWKCSGKAYSLSVGETPSTSRMTFRLQSSVKPHTNHYSLPPNGIIRPIPTRHSSPVER